MSRATLTLMGRDAPGSSWYGARLSIKPTSQNRLAAHYGVHASCPAELQLLRKPSRKCGVGGDHS